MAHKPKDAVWTYWRTNKPGYSFVVGWQSKGVGPLHISCYVPTNNAYLTPELKQDEADALLIVQRLNAEGNT
jgi:hypothetical protein